MLKLSQLFEGIDAQRFLNSALILHSQKEQLDHKTYYPVDVQRYAYLGSLSLSNAYYELIPLIKAISDKSFTVPLEDNRIWNTRLIYDFICDPIHYTISIRWNSNVIPYISGDMEPGKFCFYDPTFDSLSSDKHYKFTELMQRHFWKLRLNSEIKISIDEIRTATKTENVYPEFKDLNRNVIKPGLAAIKAKLNLDIGVSKQRNSDFVDFYLTKTTKKLLEEEFYDKDFPF